MSLIGRQPLALMRVREERDEMSVFYQPSPEPDEMSQDHQTRRDNKIYSIDQILGRQTDTDDKDHIKSKLGERLVTVSVKLVLSDKSLPFLISSLDPLRARADAKYKISTAKVVVRLNYEVVLKIIL